MNRVLLVLEANASTDINELTLYEILCIEYTQFLYVVLEIFCKIQLQKRYMYLGI